MSKPLTIDEVLTALENKVSLDTAMRINHNASAVSPKRAHSEAKAQIEAMVADIIGSNINMSGYSSSGGRGYAISYANDVKQSQRQRATKYNLNLKEK